MRPCAPSRLGYTIPDVLWYEELRAVVTAVSTYAAGSNAMYEIALEKIRRHLFREALGDLQEALRAEPEQPFYLSYYGLCLAHQTGHVEEGVEFCKRALQLAPVELLLYVNLGKAYRVRGDHGSAHRTFLRAWQLDKRHPAPAAELARMGVRRAPVFDFLPRSHWCNRTLGKLRWRLEHALTPRIS
jgi:predicted Zn-dependent protease